MEIFYEVNNDYNTVFVFYIGVINDEEDRLFAEKMSEDPLITAESKYFVDLSAAISIKRTSRSIIFSASSTNTAPKTPKLENQVAIFAPSDPNFVLAAMFTAFVEYEESYSVFRTIDSAAKWLGIPPSLINEYKKSI